MATRRSRQFQQPGQRYCREALWFQTYHPAAYLITTANYWDAMGCKDQVHASEDQDASVALDYGNSTCPSRPAAGLTFISSLVSLGEMGAARSGERTGADYPRPKLLSRSSVLILRLASLLLAVCCRWLRWSFLLSLP